MRAIGKLGEMVVGQCDELRHAAAVIATVLGFSVRPRYWGRTARDLFARQVLAVGVEPVGFVCVMAVFVGISVVWCSWPSGPARRVNHDCSGRFWLPSSRANSAPDASGRMAAQVNIRRDFFLFVRADSSAVVKRKFGVVGDAYFEITRGHGKTLPEKNATIVCKEQLPSALESAVEEIRRDAVPALKKLAAGLDTWTALGSNLITSRDRLDQIIVRAESVLTNLQQASGNLRLASTNLPAVSDALGQEAKQLPGLVLQTQTSMRELERLTRAMQRHWLFPRYVNKTNPPPLRPLAESEEPQRKPVTTFRSSRGSTR